MLTEVKIIGIVRSKPTLFKLFNLTFCFRIVVVAFKSNAIFWNWKQTQNNWKKCLNYVFWVKTYQKSALNGTLTVTVSNKKTHLADFEICVFRVYLRNQLSYKKVIYIYLYPFLMTFQMKEYFFKSGHKISWY